MRRSIAVTLLLASGLIPLAPALALDIGGGISAGGIGVGADVGASSGGVGVGAGVSAGGLGGVGVGGGASPGGVSAGGSAAVGGTGAGAAAGIGSQGSDPGSSPLGGGVSVTGEASVGRSSDAPGGSRPGGTGSVSQEAASGVGAVGSTATAGHSLSGQGPVDAAGNTADGSRQSGRAASPATGTAALPASAVPAPVSPRALAAGTPDGLLQLPLKLAPLEEGSDDRIVRRGRSPLSTGSLRALTSVPGTPPRVVAACRNALSESAAAYGAVRVDVASTARPRRSTDGGLSAPMEARIVYARSRGVQVRQARVTCQLDRDGQVVAAL